MVDMLNNVNNVASTDEHYFLSVHGVIYKDVILQESLLDNIHAQIHGVQIVWFQEDEECLLILLAQWVNSRLEVVKAHGDKCQLFTIGV